MQLLSVRLGLTKNLGNYESAKIEVEAAPETGQTLEDFLGKVNNFLDEQVDNAIAAAGGVKEKPAKKAKAEPPVKKSEGDDATQTGPATTGAATQPTNTTAEKPAAKGKGKGAAKKPEGQASTSSTGGNQTTTKTTTATSGAGNVNQPDAKKELKYALESENLDELLERFNTVRKLADQFGDKWEDAVTKIADQYRKLNSLDANPETLDAIVKAFKAERTAIEARKTAVAA